MGLKFRDEARPRFGLMRGREFVMKDGYSFHASVEDMQREFALMESSYRKVFQRLGLDFRVVEADSGAIGGSGSKEFMVLADSGEDTIVVCESCDYGANIEAAKRKKRVVEAGESLKEEKVHTPDVTSIEELSAFFKLPQSRFVKTVAMKALYDEHDTIVLFALRGDDELEETKACNAAGANELVDASEEELKAVGLVPGYMGIFDLPESVMLIVDEELKEETNMICGANDAGYHLTGITVKAKKYDDLTAVQKGDVCTCCGGSLTHTKGIEVGHIFQLGTRYSEPLKAEFLDENGKTQPFVMGTYGIGVSRLVAAIVEQHHDENGCIWTPESAPYLVDIVTANAKDGEQMALSESIYARLNDAKISTIWDDRKDRIGFKMKDFELIGFPYAIIVGKEAAEGRVELVERKTLEKTVMGVDEAIEKVGLACR